MAYCRWSSDDFLCDVYCYADVGGWYQIYVAGNRRRFTEPLPPPLDVSMDDPTWPEKYVERHQRVMGLVKDTPTEPIGGPLDGEDYRETTPAAAADRLEAIRAAGYNVPQYAIDELRAEAAGETC